MAVIRHFPTCAGCRVLPREDISGLARGLAALLADPALRARIGNLNRQKVRAEYDLHTMVARYDALFVEALAGRG